MQSSNITTTIMPLALGIIMLGLGLSLRLNDFTRIFKFPKAAFVGLFCQMILLPAVCFFVAKAFSLSPEMAVGLVLLAASPGGATANLYSHLAKGDVALNITLTAVNSLLSLATLPFIVQLGMAWFMDQDQQVPVQFTKVIQVFAIVLVPVGIGMAIRARNAPLAITLERPVRILSALFLVLVILGAVLEERASLAESFRQV